MSTKRNKPTKLVCVDLETLGKKPSSVILSIGACLFDAKGVDPQAFHQVIDIQSCLDVGLEVDGSTIQWWMKQSEEARSVFQAKSVPLKVALQNLATFVYKKAGTYNVAMVGNSARFDLSILENAYDKAVGKVFWNVFNELDYRTYKNIKGVPELVREGHHHNAADDAISQAKHAVAINKHLGGILF